MKFKVGDVVVTKACVCRPDLRAELHRMGHVGHPIGTECTVIGVNPASNYPYQLDLIAGSRLGNVHCWACENCIEFKPRPPPPREELGSWELCPWQPRKAPVSQS